MPSLFKLESYVQFEDSMKIDRIIYDETPEEVLRDYTFLVNERDAEGNKKYVSTRLHMAVYKQIEDPTEFFKQFKA